MANCFPLKKDCKRAGARLDYGFNWTRELARKWEPDLPFAAGTKIRPATDEGQTGLQYASSGGQSGPTEPPWPSVIAETVLDGTIIWTAEALTTASLTEQIADSEWESPDPDVTLDGDDTSATAGLQATIAFVSGGIVRRSYDIVNRMTTSAGKIFEGVLRLKIDA